MLESMSSMGPGEGGGEGEAEAQARVGARAAGGEARDRLGDYGVGDISRLIDDLMRSEPGLGGPPPTAAATIAALEELTYGATDAMGKCAVALWGDNAGHQKNQNWDILLLLPRVCFGCAPGENKECPVCQDEFEVGVSKCHKLPCGHLFHPSCIVPWLQTNNTCPCCRLALPTADS